MINSPEMFFEEKPERSDYKFIVDNLDKFNCSHVGYDDFKPLNYLLRDENNVLVGGLLAATLWQWLHIDILWLDEKYRNQGLGSKLLLASEQKAVERGCQFAFLDTWDFQAKEFYLKYGYEVFGELPGFPNDHCRYYLKKSLR